MKNKIKEAYCNRGVSNGKLKGSLFTMHGEA